MPAIGEVLIVDNAQRTPLVVEKAISESVVMTLNIRSQRDMQKGVTVETTGKGIEVPVGEETIGRILDALGDPLDGKPPLITTERRPIMKLPQRSTNFKVTKPEILETGIKVMDFLTPFVKGRKIGIIGGAGVGKTVLTMVLPLKKVLSSLPRPGSLTRTNAVLPFISSPA